MVRSRNVRRRWAEISAGMRWQLRQQQIAKNVKTKGRVMMLIRREFAHKATELSAHFAIHDRGAMLLPLHQSLRWSLAGRSIRQITRLWETFPSSIPMRDRGVDRAVALKRAEFTVDRVDLQKRHTEIVEVSARLITVCKRPPSSATLLRIRI